MRDKFFRFLCYIFKMKIFRIFIVICSLILFVILEKVLNIFNFLVILVLKLLLISVLIFVYVL